MDPLTVLVVLAFLATAGALASGVTSMAYDSEVGHRNSAQWMNVRVGIQSAAFLLILLALLIA